jgi:hypothetical protein
MKAVVVTNTGTIVPHTLWSVIALVKAAGVRKCALNFIYQPEEYKKE